jgi:hypothetical protein
MADDYIIINEAITTGLFADYEKDIELSDKFLLIGQKYKTTIEEIFYYDKKFPPQKDIV